MICLGGATALVLNAFRSKLMYFYTPSDLIPYGQVMRMGGLVKDGSIVWEKGHQRLRFCVTDGMGEKTVNYCGVVPDLFREGQGVVVEGTLTPEGMIDAEKILAKHDETYMPPDLAKSLKEKGYWRENAMLKNPNS